jgi:predicted RNA-binding protein with PIN domain
MADGPAAYSLYDLLRTLIERVGWPTEDEKRVALASVDRAEQMQILGNLANQMTCSHPAEDMSASGKCGACGKQIEVEQSTWGRNRYGAQSGRGW